MDDGQQSNAQSAGESWGAALPKLPPTNWLARCVKLLASGSKAPCY